LIRLIAEPNECANLNIKSKHIMENTNQSSANKQLIALVTGANQGVGFQIAKALGAQGYTVYVGARNLSNGEKAAAEIGNNAHPFQLDVTDQATITAAAAYIEQEHGRLDLLVNNAGISHSGKVTEGRSAPAARIVNVSSGLASLSWIADPNTWAREHFDIVYGASKTAMNAVTMAFALELEKENIKVNAVSPGFTATALNNFQGTDSLEVGSREPVRVALDMDGPDMTFTGPEGQLQW
jgi:NAD(P)-dependent dehydrogenase (short-subunit alcohol dehydrogenase family)